MDCEGLGSALLPCTHADQEYEKLVEDCKEDCKKMPQGDFVHCSLTLVVVVILVGVVCSSCAFSYPFGFGLSKLRLVPKSNRV